MVLGRGERGRRKSLVRRSGLAHIFLNQLSSQAREEHANYREAELPLHLSKEEEEKKLSRMGAR